MLTELFDNPRVILKKRKKIKETEDLIRSYVLMDKNSFKQAYGFNYEPEDKKKVEEMKKKLLIEGFNGYFFD